jgi:uncharacterized membrane protein YhaH (DUF805 family)
MGAGVDGMRNDWKDIFLSSVGRMSRAPFLLASAVLIALTAFYESIASSVTHWVTGWFVYPVLVFCGASVLSKRLHDRGRSGWWSAVILLAIMVVWPHPKGVVAYLFTLVLFWTLIDLGLMPGEQGVNRYGPNPLKPLPAV